ncbi:MAG: ribosomal RNA small subunit methyltransferase A [Candidatus Nealsonbacteria bacterium RBG_13_42_11]|uniref:Ribosomal RNA small subunit methyltransferase A n=1 Tax=Candidatus Nealsonbacteria bacterium RBG_13_42_11 TaxID=1801663 RepID=A0A1G2E1C3_9BACT|nr:MAG: ribosomal RNA small subunit methyltransferase A [Candidatus Nealsonbacteria bacterium RBG_13_42_11]
MDLTSLKTVKDLLQKYQIRPLKGLGQNFLVDEEVLDKIIGSAELKENDTVLEIGSGIGTLTLELAKKVKKVIAVEKDLKMCGILQDLLESQNVRNVEIIKGDILKINTKYYIPNTKYKIVANLPYYITSPVIRKFLEIETPPLTMILMVQKEVGRRVCAKPPDMSILAVSVQFYAQPEILSFVSKKSFWPEPEIDSAIIKITPTNSRRNVLRGLFFKIVKVGFLQPRKQLINNLSNGLKINREQVKNWLLTNGVNPTQRAETLTVEDWLNLVNTLK